MRETIPEDLKRLYERAHDLSMGFSGRDDVKILIERIAKAEARNKVLEEALREVLPYMQEPTYDKDRCQICCWPLKASIEEGCTADSCSYRPQDHSPEWYRLRCRRTWVKANAALREDR